MNIHDTVMKIVSDSDRSSQWSVVKYISVHQIDQILSYICLVHELFAFSKRICNTFKRKLFFCVVFFVVSFTR